MKNRFFSILSVLVIAAMVFTTGAAAQPATPAVQVVDKGLKATLDTVYSESTLKSAIQNSDGRLSIIVQLAEPPLALYSGGVPNLAATSAQATGKVKLDANSPASKAYVQHLIDTQTAFVSQLAKVAPSATTSYTYQTAFNGVSMKVARSEISKIAMMSDVIKIFPDQIRYAEMDASLPLIKAQAMWTKLGGQSNAGKGIKVADVDTGLDVKNPMFSGIGFTAPAGYPKGFCVTNPADPDFKCNDKVIVGRWYFDPGLIPPDYVLDPAEVMTPFGIASHGTHTAGTITGNPVTATVQGISFDLSGVAPAAYLMVYKGLFSVKSGSTYNASGTDSMLVAALNDATADGADVINNSWGGGVGDPNTIIYKSVIGAITAAGTLVVFSAGNSGPGGGTIGCPGCVEDALTVAASTTNRILANRFDVTGPGTVPAILTNLGVFSSGKVITSPISAEIRYKSDNDLGCVAYPAGYFTGAVALISRGTCTFAVKQTNAVNAGAIAVVIITNAGGPPVGMSGVDPTNPIYMIDMTNGIAVRNWVQAALTPATVTIGAITVKVINNAYQDVMAGFSSVGPDGDPNVLKPDITAPGVNILSASSPAIISGATEPWFEFLQGTSMAAPHITGSAALVMQQHPDWTPWQVRTALTSTAVQTLVQPNGVTPATPFQMGSGRVDLERASKAGLTFTKSSFTNSTCMLTCSWMVNVKNVTSGDATWTATAVVEKAPLVITVTPATVKLAPGGSMDVKVTADVSQVLPGSSYVFGSVTWKNAGGAYTDAYLPVTVAAGTTTNAAILSETVNKATANAGDELTYTINISNPYTSKTTFSVESTLSQDLTYKAASATGGLHYDPATRKLSGSTTLDPFVLDIAPTGVATKYVAGTPATSLDLTANCPAADPVCDEVVFNITGMDFWYLGTHYTSVKVSSNGFITPGTVAINSAATPQKMPNTGTPNNVIAPLWSDFDFANAGAKWLIWGTATDTVFEWQNVEEFGSAGAVRYNFEIWIKDTTNQITFAYGPLNADLATPSGSYLYGVGAENVNGTTGKSYYYYDGVGSPSGTAPVTGTDLNVANELNSATMTFMAKVALKNAARPVITNLVTEVSNFDATVNQALAYTTVKTYKYLFPLINQ